MIGHINGVDCEYEFCPGEPCVVFLHGWGGDMRSFAAAYSAVIDWGYGALNLAFPKDVPPDWGIFDYASMVAELLRQNGIVHPIVVGHSFGGRVAVILASQGLCSKTVLVDSAGLRPRRKLSRAIKIARYRRAVKRGKPLDGMGSIDYNNTEPTRRGVFVRIVNSHLDRLLPYIKCPTLIVWGRADKETPPYMAKRLHTGIAGSRLVMLDGGHYAYIDSGYGFLRELKAFISE